MSSALHAIKWRLNSIFKLSLEKTNGSGRNWQTLNHGETLGELSTTGTEDRNDFGIAVDMDVTVLSF